MERAGQHIWHHKLLWYAVMVATAAMAMQLGIGQALHELVWRG